MSKDLVIVESPAKARTINKFLGKDFLVKASMGHVRDLPEDRLGVDIKRGFRPTYRVIPGKEKIIRDIKEVADKARYVYLATDPDREGEAICWHIAQLLGDGEKFYRVTFNEITKQAVLEAIKNPGRIDIKRVEAQQARRILDRLVGYKISPLLWRKVRGGLSAGRVQSVALRLVCEREEEIEKFVPEEYWTLKARFAGVGEDGKEYQFEAELTSLEGEKAKLKNKEEVDRLLERLGEANFRIAKVVKRVQKRHPQPPFTTSKLQQEAHSRFKFSAKKTMVIAQQLYEGIDVGEGPVGLITYMRTDSVRVAEYAQAAARRFIKENFGEEFLPEKPNQYKNPPRAQAAHEAIRPTDPTRTPEQIKEYLTQDQYKLYSLIWKKFMASQMAPALFDTTRFDIEGDRVQFRANWRSLKFAGFLILREEEKEESMPPPPLAEGTQLRLLEFLPEQHFTESPPRYTEGSLVKALEEKGIGRPSTYAPIISTIQERGYVERDREGRLRPTQLGIIVTKLLVENFPDIMDVNFTAEMEDKLDRIEQGVLDWVEVLQEFYGSFQKALERAASSMRNVKGELEVDIGENCPECGAPLKIKWGRWGRFIACSNFPNCRYTRTYSEDTGIKCPKEGCSGNIVRLRSKKGKVYYKCSDPKCDFIIFYEPIDEKCPVCGAPFLVLRGRKRLYKVCINEGCDYKAPLKEEGDEAKEGEATG